MPLRLAAAPAVPRKSLVPQGNSKGAQTARAGLRMDAGTAANRPGATGMHAAGRMGILAPDALPAAPGSPLIRVRSARSASAGAALMFFRSAPEAGKSMRAPARAASAGRGGGASGFPGAS